MGYKTIDPNSSLQTFNDMLTEISVSINDNISPDKGLNFIDYFTKSTDSMDVSLSSSSNIAASNEVFGLLDGEMVGGIRMYKENGNNCEKDEDCPDEEYCLTHVERDFPVANRCYECINSNHCEKDEQCSIDRSNAVCGAIDVQETPSIGKVEHGYNIYKGDPFYILGTSDPGHTTSKFYNQVWNTDATYKISLEGETFYFPEGFTVQSTGNCKKKSTTNSISTTDSFKSAIGKTISYGASGTIKGVELGGGVGTSSYKEITKRSKASESTTESSSYCSLYSFFMAPGDKKEEIKSNITPRAKERLRSLGSDTSWFDFFETYGTHLITKGEMGAFERMSTSFTKSQREDLSKVTGSFETSVSIGIPGIFGLEREESTSESTEIGNMIQNMNKNLEAVTGGNIEDMLRTPALINKHLEPICEFMDHSDKCFGMLKKYCIRNLKEAGLDPGIECKYPEKDEVHCAVTSDCGEMEECKEGECKLVPSLYACNLCVRDHWTSCTWNPGCPRGYRHSRWENGPCTFWTSRRVCRKEWNCNSCADCGGHYAASCKWCPFTSKGESKGKAWCNGECKWTDNKCV